MHPIQLQGEVIGLQDACIRTKTLAPGPCYIVNGQPPSCPASHGMWGSPDKQLKMCVLCVYVPHIRTYACCYMTQLYITCEKSVGQHLAEPGLTTGRQAGSLADEIWVRLETLKKYSIFHFSTFNAFLALFSGKYYYKIRRKNCNSALEAFKK